MIKCFRTLLTTMVVALVLATGFSASPVLAAGNGTTVGSLNLTATIECIGVYASFGNDDNGSNNALLEYRTAGGTWKHGMALTVDRRVLLYSDTYDPNPWVNQWRGSIIGLLPNTQYDVRVTFTDADGVTGTNPITGSITTKKDNFSLGSGTNYYVATTGSDSAAGTIGAPWLTLQHAVDNVSAGDNIYIRAGTYHGSFTITTSGTSSNYITILNYPNESVILDFDNATTGILFNEASYWRILGLLDNTDYSYIQGLFSRLAYTNPRAIKDVFEDNYEGFIGLTLQNISTKYPGLPGHGSAVIELFRGSSYNVIEGVKIQDYGYAVPDAGVLVNGGSDHNLIQYNIITSARDDYVEEHPGEHREVGVCFCYVDIYFTDPYPEYPGIGNVVKYNHIYSNNLGISDGVGGYANTYIDDGLYKDADVYGNYIHGTGDDGVECEGGDINVRVWGNVIDDTWTGFAIAPVVVGPAYIFRNVITNPRAAVIKAGKNGDEPYDGTVYIYHNSVYAPQTDPGRVEGFTNYGGNGWQNHHLRNNIIYTSGYTMKVQIPASTNSNNDYDYDCLYQPTEVSNLFAKWSDTVMQSLAALQSASGQETHGIGGYNTGDPLYVSPATDLHLQAGSPCRNVGLVIPGFNDANSPWPFSGSAPDIGAYEYDSGAPPVNDADINSDGSVNILDMISIAQHWGETGAGGWIRADVNNDGTINILDITLVGQNWTG